MQHRDAWRAVGWVSTMICVKSLVYMLIAVYAGCAVDDPTTQMPSEVAPPAGADAAIAIVLDVYHREAGVSVDHVTVRWFDGELPFGELTASGLTAGCDDIRIALDGPSGLIPYTLSHELAHCALRTLHGNEDGDREHVDPVWWLSGALVDRAHIAVRSAGL